MGISAQVHSSVWTNLDMQHTASFCVYENTASRHQPFELGPLTRQTLDILAVSTFDIFRCLIFIDIWYLVFPVLFPFSGAHEVASHPLPCRCSFHGYLLHDRNDLKKMWLR
jgi:hypothetical protein